MDYIAIISAFGVGNLTGALLRDHLTRRADLRKRRMETDRATYDDRVTRLVRGNLGSFIRSNRCRNGDLESLTELVGELTNGAHRKRFLDKEVQTAWALLVDKSVECGRLRLDGTIAEQQIATYVKVWERFINAAKASFGPVTEADCPSMRRVSAETESLPGAA